MDVVGGFLLAAVIIIGAITVFGWLTRLVARIATAVSEDGVAKADDPVERAKTAALGLDYNELNVEWFERKSEIQEHIDRLSRPDIPLDQVIAMSRSEIPTVAAIALSALARRNDLPHDWTTRAIGSLSSCDTALEPFVYRALLTNAAYPVIGPALCKLDEAINWEALARFIERRREAGEIVDSETLARNVPVRMIPTVELFIDRYEPYLGDDFRGFFEEWRRGAVDVDFLADVGRVLERPYDSPQTFLNERRNEVVELVREAVESKPRRSVLLVGEHGVGKSALIRAALDRLPSRLVVFEASAAQINAGAMWVGELEGRIKELADKLRGHDVVWLLPGFEETLYAGQHSRSPKGMLDALLPHIERGELTVIGEVSPVALEALLAERPRLAGAFEILRVRPLDEAGAIAAAEHALTQAGLNASSETLRDTYDLAQQFLPGIAAPGNVLKLLAATRALVEEQSRHEIESSDVLAALAATSGLPLTILDPESRLEREAVERFFESRVLGQPEAVAAIVDRIFLAKARLNDPTRPLGVLLFVGPTGTGKTEIAKALAEFMFGSERRLIRVDMSEFQTPDALDRLLQDASVEQRGSVLLSAVRKEPFAVVLLDEFEKAAPPIWDLFLQVFDDGRLTDQQGRTADFRRCIIILTSNIGSALAHRPRVGFEAAHGQFREELIQRELKRSFRPEFLNRIDRVVIFRPFERAQTRALLEKELAAALARRGLRGRPWAIELDDSAYEFLIERGFSPELGARPLKRAVERYLLAPIAEAIVQQSVPEGDQFLLVSAPTDDRIEVAFIDPDAPSERPERDADELGEALDVRAVARSAASHGDAVMTVLLDQLSRTSARVHGELRDRKEAALRAMHEPDFWEDEGRHVVLADAEYLDRLQVACETAEKMGERLRAAMGRNGGAPVGELAALLALRLHVLESAIEGLARGQPADVFVHIRPTRDSASDEGHEWADALATMYERWAEQRGMRLRRLAADEHLYAVTGLGASVILAPESGIHVLESADQRGNGRELERVAVVVQVAPWQQGPGDREPLADLARRALADKSETPSVVRRYRRTPSPLVRDAVRGYRTGRLDRILAGDFDLF